MHFLVLLLGATSKIIFSPREDGFSFFNDDSCMVSSETMQGDGVNPAFFVDDSIKSCRVHSTLVEVFFGAVFLQEEKQHPPPPSVE